MPTSDTPGRLTRRRLLRLGALAGAGGLAGCEGLLGGGEGDGRGATTTGAGTGTSSTSTGTRTMAAPDPSPTQSGAPTDAPTEGTTTEPSVDEVTFDGGGAAALADALRTVEANPGSTLVVEPGTYRLDGLAAGSDYRAGHFVARGLRDVTLEGNDAEFVLQDARLGGLHLFRCRSTTVRDLTLDYERPPFTRATITRTAASSRTIEAEVDGGFPTLEQGVFRSVEPAWATVHDPATGDFQDSACCGGSVLNFDGYEALGGRRYRFRNVRPWRGLEAGRWLVPVARVPEGAALQVVGGANVLLEGVTVHASPLFVALLASTAAPVVRDVTARPRPGSGWPIATTADGIHVVNCDPGPTIERCQLERLQDDAVAIDSKMHRVEALVDPRTVRVAVVAGTVIEPGDALEGISPGYDRLGSLPAVRAVDQAGRRGWPSALGAPRRVTFERPIDATLEPGSFLLNESRRNAGFAIRDCVVRDIRARHLRITSRDGVVEANALDGSTSPSILLAPTTGYSFHPKGPAEGVTIRNNTVTRAARNGFTTPWPAAILVWADLARGIGDRPPGQPNRDIVVAENDVRDPAHRGIHVADTDGVEIRGNLVHRPNRQGKAENAYGLALVNDRDVSVTGNRVSGPSEALSDFGVRETTSGLTASGNEFVVDGSLAAARFVDG